MFRLFLLALMGYLGFKYVKKATTSKDAPVQGKNANSPLDLKKQDVSDAEFEDLSE